MDTAPVVTQTIERQHHRLLCTDDTLGLLREFVLWTWLMNHWLMSNVDCSNRPYIFSSNANFDKYSSERIQWNYALFITL